MNGGDASDEFFLMAWVDNYCKANPLAKVTTGAAILVQELRERAQRR